MEVEETAFGIARVCTKGAGAGNGRRRGFSRDAKIANGGCSFVGDQRLRREDRGHEI